MEWRAVCQYLWDESSSNQNILLEVYFFHFPKFVFIYSDTETDASIGIDMTIDIWIVVLTSSGYFWLKQALLKTTELFKLD